MKRETMLALAGLLWTGAALAAEGTIDKLVIKGDAAVLKLSTDAQKPYRLDLNKSGWDEGKCSAQARQEGGVVTITVKLNDKLLGKSCRLEIAGNLKPGKLLEVSLNTVKGSINGEYKAVSVDSQALELELAGKAGNLTLAGSAIKAQAKGAYDKLVLKGQALKLGFEGRSRELSLDGQAVKAELKLTDPKPSGTLALDATSGSLKLSLPKSASLQYEVRGTASAVDSKLPSTAGAPLKLNARGQALKVEVVAD